ncbi:RHS repeat domain-containing protein, partial [Vandammella animalimorsus]|uniref:RHS repeat domain-containing protein n=1 Tax=Vandammella animalimorsus TaxID=2029117 RepID=UPI001553DABE
MRAKFIFVSLAATLALWLPNFAHPWVEGQDPRGNSLDFHEDGIRHSGVDGWALQFVRDAQGRISQIHGAGQTHHYQYDSAGNLISHSEPSGAQSNYRYSA